MYKAACASVDSQNNLRAVGGGCPDVGPEPFAPGLLRLPHPYPECASDLPESARQRSADRVLLIITTLSIARKRYRINATAAFQSETGVSACKIWRMATRGPGTLVPRLKRCDSTFLKLPRCAEFWPQGPTFAGARPATPVAAGRLQARRAAQEPAAPQLCRPGWSLQH